MSRDSIVVPFSGIEISGDLGVGIELSSGIVILNDVNQVDSETRRDWSMNAPKLLETVENAGAFIYGQLSVSVANEDRMPLLERKRRHVYGFLTGLWMLRDNAVNGKEVSLIHGLGRVGLEYTHVFLNARGAGYKGCTPFTRAEIEQAVTYSRWCEERVLLHDDDTGVTTSTRLSRAGFFLQTARRTHDVGLRTSLYCSSLEALLCTTDKGIKTQLATRVALLLGEVPSETEGVGKEMRDIYKRRSEFMHGDDVPEDSVMTLSTASVRCDDILRKVFVAIHAVPIPDQKNKLDAHFEKPISQEGSRSGATTSSTSACQ